MKISLRIILFFFLKYFLFYLFLRIKKGTFIINNFGTMEDFIFALFVFLPLPLISIIIFAIPLYYSFKIKSLLIFFLIFFLYIIIEYFIYTYLTSQQHIDKNGLYNALISIIVFGLMFFKQIKMVMVD